MLRKIISKSLIFLFLIMGSGYLLYAQSNNWEAPDKAREIKNPLKGNEDAKREGKKTFDKLCVVCHGNKGKGDGLAGVNLDPRPTDLTSQKVQDQSDGAIYWKITTGRPPMASYKGTLSDKECWQLVNFIRSLGK